MDFWIADQIHETNQFRLGEVIQGITISNDISRSAILSQLLTAAYTQPGNLIASNMRLNQDADANGVGSKASISAKKDKPKYDKVWKMCTNWGGPDEDLINPEADAKSFFVKGRDSSKAGMALYKKEWESLKATRAELLDPPLYGRYQRLESGLYRYIPPNIDYKGEDRWSFIVELNNGKTVLLKMQLSPGASDLRGNECKINLLGLGLKFPGMGKNFANVDISQAVS